jgi:hypothetical protein
MHIMGPLWILLLLTPELEGIGPEGGFFQAGRLFAGPLPSLPA